MKISALILAHNNLNFLNRLCNKLSPHFNIYIHLDKKCNESIPETLQNAHFAKKRYDINWGSYEMIEATYALLEAAYNDDCEYFILLSGADYPIKPIIDIKTFFENHANISFIAHAPLPVEGLKEGGFDRLWYYWMSSKKVNTRPLIVTFMHFNVYSIYIAQRIIIFTSVRNGGISIEPQPRIY